MWRRAPWPGRAARRDRIGEAMGSVDFKDLDETPDKVLETAAMCATNAAHLAKLLKSNPLPGAK